MTADYTYGGWFSGRAHRSPHRIALTFEGRDWTYRQMMDDIDRLAAVLREQGAGQGDRVAYVGENHPLLLQTMIAAGRIGAVFVPLNYRLSPAELHYVITDSGARVVVADGPRQEVIGQIKEDLGTIGRLGVEGAAEGWTALEDALAAAEPISEPAEVANDDLAIIMYTSGTTGNPKGVMLTHANLWWCQQSLMLLYDVHGDDVTLAVSPLFHIAGLNVTIPTTWLKGGRVVLQRAFDVKAFVDDIEKYQVNSLFGVPTMFVAMLGSPGIAERDLSSVRVAICGGAPAPLDLLSAMSDLGISVLQGYGLTETAPVAIFLVAEHALTKIGSCGFPAMYVEAKLVDSDGAVIAHDTSGVRGEIHLRGPNLSSGYWNKPEATAAAFDDEGWFHTGDVGEYDEDGFCYVVDRIKDLIISGGENIFPAEVENVIYSHPAVVDAAVIGLPHPKWGEAVTAVVVTRAGSGLELAELREFATDKLARYKLPIALHVVEELPRNSTGKLLKNVLRDTLKDG